MTQHEMEVPDFKDDEKNQRGKPADVFEYKMRIKNNPFTAQRIQRERSYIQAKIIFHPSFFYRIL